MTPVRRRRPRGYQRPGWVPSVDSATVCGGNSLPDYFDVYAAAHPRPLGLAEVGCGRWMPKAVPAPSCTLPAPPSPHPPRTLPAPSPHRVAISRVTYPRWRPPLPPRAPLPTTPCACCCGRVALREECQELMPGAAAVLQHLTHASQLQLSSYTDVRMPWFDGSSGCGIAIASSKRPTPNSKRPPHPSQARHLRSRSPTPSPHPSASPKPDL